MTNDVNSSTLYYNTEAEYMYIPFYSYLYTVFLGFGCYSFISPNFANIWSLQTAYTLGNAMFRGFMICDDYVYQPFIKYLYNPFNKNIYKPLARILSIDETRDEIWIIKDGVVIYSFKTMADFIKNNPIKFIKDDIDDDDDESEDNCDSQGERNDGSNNVTETGSAVDTVVDNDLTNKDTNVHDLVDESNDGEDDETEDEDEDEEDEDEDEDEDEEDEEDEDYILDPKEYDFLFRTMYYENEETNDLDGVCFKYETFYKSDFKKVYTISELKTHMSTRKLIGANLHMDSKKYSINLNTPVNYLVNENSLLGFHFLKWYMAGTYNVVLHNNYSVFCIDNSIGMYELRPGKQLLVYKDYLKLVDDDTYTDVSSEASADADSNTSKNVDESNKRMNDICDIEVLGYD